MDRNNTEYLASLMTCDARSLYQKYQDTDTEMCKELTPKQASDMLQLQKLIYTIGQYRFEKDWEQMALYGIDGYQPDKEVTLPPGLLDGVS